MDGMPMGEPLGDKNAGGSSGGKRRAATSSSGIIARERGTRYLTARCEGSHGAASREGFSGAMPRAERASSSVARKPHGRLAP